MLLTFLALTKVSAQEVKNQTEEIKSLKKGKYLLYYITKDKKTGKYSYSSSDSDIELTQVLREKNFPEHTYLEIKKKDGSAEYHLPDNMAFPITLAQIYYEGNAKQQKEVGYVPYKIRPGRTHRKVVHQGIIYNYTSDFYYDSPESYIPYSLYVPESYGKENGGKKPKKKKKKKKSFFSQLASLGDEKTYASLIHHTEKELYKKHPVDNVIAYLKKAVPKQKQEYKRWISKPSNKKRIDDVEKKRDLMYKAINNYNEALKQTPEWKRIQENNRLADAAAKRNNTTIQNNTGRDIYVYQKGSYNSARINAGSSRTFSCNETYYYTFSGNSKWSAGAKISGTSCGGTATVR